MPSLEHQRLATLDEQQDEPKSTSTPIKATDFEVLDDVPSAPLSILKLLASTCGIGGLQVVWATIFSNGTPYMLSLGLPKTLTPLVWSAAPICGCTIQAYVGRWSDNCTHSWGRRRPFILAGAAGVTIFLLLLGWSCSLAEFVNLENVSTTTGNVNSTAATILAALSFWGLSLAIQPLQCGLRALILDACPLEQQSIANAYASRFTALGNIFGCAVGALDLSHSRYGTGQARFQMLCLMSIFAVDITAMTTCLTIKESTLVAEEVLTPKGGLLSMTGDIMRTLRDLPDRTKHILKIQLFNWLAWFGFMFYSASYVGELYSITIRNYVHEAHSQASRQSSSVFDIQSLDESSRLGTLANLLVAIVAFGASSVLPQLVGTRDSKVSAWFRHGTCPTLGRLWAYSLIFAATLMLSTIFVSHHVPAMMLISLMGIPWALATWAPFALIGDDLLEVGDVGHTSRNGAVMGLQNLAISAPQILAAALSTIIIKIAQDWGSMDTFGWVLRGGSIAFLVASYMAFQLEENIN